ncbi:hypothetical protein QTP70_022584 [Hemibagrus guttatus]|uniref:PPM-type phosphatase domain-containing protein n=1 Tax=Hemibagrus guttatus TaxID=175788 RepID=A0AAE0VFE0_9TELE|nr:hypothetical protein QTP70_022584 [Hemibagrus guttatus]
MSMAALVQLASHCGSRMCRRMVLNRVHLIQDKLVRSLHSPSSTHFSNSRFDPDSSGHPTTWDSFGIWDNRIDEPILLPSSIRYGKPIPKVSLSKVGYASQIGQRKENEDRYQVSQMTNDIIYFAVFDGHGGAQAADFCHKYMEQHIRELVAKEGNLEVVLTNAFLNVDKELAKHLQCSADGRIFLISSWFYLTAEVMVRKRIKFEINRSSMLSSGTTATVALLRDGIELVVASVGDSRAMLCRKSKALKLTVDHTPERKDEKERIRKSGGFVTWNSLGQPHVNGRLAMTRSIGDFDLKNAGVIAEPETKRISLHHVHDAFLALTTDGINFIMNSQEICDVINQCNDPKEAAQRLSEQALQYGAEDNSTVIVVPFGAWGKHKSSDVSFSFSRSFVSSGRWA